MSLSPLETVPVDFLPNKLAITSLLSKDSDSEFFLSSPGTPCSDALPPIKQLLPQGSQSLEASNPSERFDSLPKSMPVSNVSPPANDGGSSGPIRRRKRADSHQLAMLNAVFAHTFFPSTDLRCRLGKELGMSPRSVQIWFQNKRQQWRVRRKLEDQHDFYRRHEDYWPSVNSVGMGLLPVPIGGVPLFDRASAARAMQFGFPSAAADKTMLFQMPVITTIPMQALNAGGTP